MERYFMKRIGQKVVVKNESIFRIVMESICIFRMQEIRYLRSIDINNTYNEGLKGKNE